MLAGPQNPIRENVGPFEAIVLPHTTKNEPITKVLLDLLPFAPAVKAITAHLKGANQTSVVINEQTHALSFPVYAPFISFEMVVVPALKGSDIKVISDRIQPHQAEIISVLVDHLGKPVEELTDLALTILTKGNNETTVFVFNQDGTPAEPVIVRYSAGLGFNNDFLALASSGIINNGERVKTEHCLTALAQLASK